MPDRQRAVAVNIFAWLALLSFTVPAAARNAPLCGERGVWLQILGSSSAELDTDRAPASYLIWLDGQARLLVDPGPGSAYNFRRAGANFSDLEAIAFSSLGVGQSADFVSFVAGSASSDRSQPLPVLGPDGNDQYPSTQAFVEALIGTRGVYQYLADYLTFKGGGGYKITPRSVPATGRRRWARFGSSNLKLAAIPVNQAGIPTLAWRAEIGGAAVVFTGNFNNEKNVVAEFAKGADALVIHHAIVESARGAPRARYVIPSQIGRIAAQADARMIILGNRTARTLGLESQSRVAIEAHYSNALIFANELECWGM